MDNNYRPLFTPAAVFKEPVLKIADFSFQLKNKNYIVRGRWSVTKLRKRKNWSQADLAKAVEASCDIIGKYERNENSPSIEMAVKIADAFDVTIDYLIDNGKYAAYDKDVIERIEDIQALDANTRTTLFNVIDTYLRDYQVHKA
ncbi:helix-turn-helix transcriptional regulator [Chitinophaga sp. CB10]|uniref:helix-turn-helix domain-containing protein n=1 Tax=Chitinophaga sp. CB10 TaxID=1891659 RepID=UPI0025B8B7AD|nr:helix-turn-helix transcriptional regulator [Chitinophaga sp. CB10]